MTTMTLPTSAADMPAMPDFPLHRLSIRQYHQLAEHGVLTEDDDVEFLQGWLVDKLSNSLRHDATVARLTHLLLPLLPAGWTLRIQSAITTSDSEPEPDLAIVRERPDDYVATHPEPGGIGLVIEVAEATLVKDRRKAAIYAAGCVPAYWIVNLDRDCIEACEQPVQVDGRYAQQRTFELEDAISLRLDGVECATLRVRQLLASRS
ncbi:MAG TPA: Uma2 family endonuclease [Planctomycetaceae bacterium]|nr:Uma2 family endonuclease [Planctomycetaceae bacterium]